MAIIHINPELFQLQVQMSPITRGFAFTSEHFRYRRPSKLEKSKFNLPEEL